MQCTVQRSFIKSLSFNTTRAFSGYKAKKTSLENGVTVVSTEQPENDVLASVGVFVATGSSKEHHHNHGCSHYLRRFLYKGTNRVSGLKLTRTVENLLATFEAENHVDHLSYKSTFPQENLPEALAIMGDVLRPKLAEWEFRDVRSLVQGDVNERNGNLELKIEDAVRHTAFGGVGLGNSVLCPQYNVNQIYPEHVAEYILGHVVGSNITVVANVADHEKLVEYVFDGFGELPKDSVVEVTPAASPVYYGGSRLDSGSTNAFALAFEGASNGSKDVLSQAILLEILGSNKCASGSRLGKSLCGSGISASSFVLEGSKSVFGIRAIGSSQSTASLAETVKNSFDLKITEEEFQRAKQLVLTKAVAGFDNRRTFLSDLYQSSLGSGLSGVSLGDVQEFASRITKGKPTVYASGNLSGLPSFAY